MSDLHATERIIGGLIVVGVASLLNWSHSQSGDPGMIGMMLIGAMLLGSFWVAAGLIELFTGPRDQGRVAAPATPDQPAPRS